MPSLDGKERAVLLKQAEEHGARVEQRGNGHIIFPPNGGKLLTLHSSVSDNNGWRVFRQHWRQADLGPWPWDGYTAPKEKEIEMPKSHNYVPKGEARKKLVAFLENLESDRVRTKTVAEFTGASGPTIAKFFRDSGWTLVGRSNASEWVRPRPVEVTSIDHQLVEEVAERVEQGEITSTEAFELVARPEPSVLDQSIEEHLAADLPEVTEERDATPDEAFQLGEVSGYQQAHDELMPKIDKLSKELDTARRGVDDLLTERNELFRRLDEALYNNAEQERQYEVTRNQLRDYAARFAQVESRIHDGTWEFRDDLITGSTMLADLREMIAAAGLEYEIRVWRMDGKV